MENPPLNYLRKDNKTAKGIKFVMFVLGVVWASYFWLWETPYDADYLAEGWSPTFLMIVVLTSDTLKLILESKVMKFMGKISFMMYLIHPLFHEGFMVDLYLFLISSCKFDPAFASILSFIILTPLLFAFSYFLTVFVDIPAKDFAFNLDTYLRNERPKKSDENYYSRR
tara:strand:- start:346 stop:852 length:507 start_codon:yes stop_codon:yes gene_type:complete